MADFLYNGWGLPRNELEAIRWARSGAEQNDPRSLNFLGFCHSGWAQGCTGISQNFATSATFFRRAAIQGLASAQRNLGFMYLNGHGVTRNDNEAFRFFQLAAQQRDAQAEFFLGVMHEEGRGVSPDRNQAFRWYQRAAEQGNTNAQQRLVQDRPFMIARAREAAAAQERGDYEGALSIYRDLERIYAEAVRRTTYTNTDEHLSLSLVRANIAQIENNQRLLLVRPSYQTRTKSVLEQILNFTTTGVLEGSEKHFWISGHENTHKCILTPFSAVSSSTLTPVDVRTFNQTAFQFNVRGSCDAGGRNSVTVRVGDETNAVTAIYGPLSSIGASCDKAPSMERLQRAWELAFRECPGRRSAF
jgi:TPR repeat protein